MKVNEKSIRQLVDIYVCKYQMYLNIICIRSTNIQHFVHQLYILYYYRPKNYLPVLKLPQHKYLTKIIDFNFQQIQC